MATGNNQLAKIITDSKKERRLFRTVRFVGFGNAKEIGVNLDPEFLLTTKEPDQGTQTDQHSL